MASIYISAAHKSSGKTTLSIGLGRALAHRGLTVQPFKKGPDYIDPLWLHSATGRGCYNLDFYTMHREEIEALYRRRMQGADIGLIEGNKGLYDGLDIEGSNSNAALAALLNVPVVLVINTKGMTRGIAPLLLGYQAFDHNISISGVILNQVGGSRHESKLVNVVEHYTDIPVLGAVANDPSLGIDERHLGLVPNNERSQAEEVIDYLAKTVTDCVDLDRLIEIAGEARSVPRLAAVEETLRQDGALRIGYPKDMAFGFYYPDDLEALQHHGAELVPFDALNDERLPEVDGLFIGGGFPETSMDKLEANVSIRGAIRDYIEQGGVVYAECGGLMYLCRSLTWQGKKCRMVGIIPADAVMHERPQGRGYVRLTESGNSRWGEVAEKDGDGIINAHEFHYSALEGLDAESSDFAYEVIRGTGIDSRHDGYIYKNLLANYTHMRNVGGCHWVERFLSHVRAMKALEMGNQGSNNDV